MVKFTTQATRIQKDFKNIIGSACSLDLNRHQSTVIIVLKQDVFSVFMTNKLILLTKLLSLSLLFMWFRTLLALCLCTAVFVISFLLQFAWTVREESVILVKSVGCQIVTKYVIGEKHLFIPCNSVQSFFINEVILQNRVVHLLTILSNDCDQHHKLVPLFFGVKPRLYILEIIYRHLRSTVS